MCVVCLYSGEASCPVAFADESTASASAASPDSGASASSDTSEPKYAHWSLEDLNKAVAEKTAQRDELQSKMDTLVKREEENNARLAQINEQMPQEQQRAERAVVERYKVQRQFPSLMELLLESQDLSSFIAGVEYIEAASDASMDTLTELRRQETECQSQAKQITDEKAHVSLRLDVTQADLTEATAARDEKQRLADLVANTRLTPDGANWDAGEEAFVAEWAPRIEGFLVGSPLAGQGSTFAKAAWANHIDPRWSAAISNIESSKGAICIRPHNAWGWGAADSDPYNLAWEWGSWEEAINAHAQGLSSFYGYTVSVEGAQKYCPPNWENWYVTVVNGMNSM